MAIILRFPPQPTAFDRSCERADRLVTVELLRAYDEGGEKAASELLHCIVWAAARMSAKIDGVRATRFNFANAGRYGYDPKVSRP
jgi:hypothetical protein